MTGRKLTEAELEAEARRLARGGKDEEEPLVWGTGLKQQADQADAQARMLAAARQPFARYTDDPTLFEERRNEERFGDPMQQLKKVRCYPCLSLWHLCF